MEVSVIDYTGMGTGDDMTAANKMIFTKQTRLKMNPDLMQEIEDWPLEKKMEELEYMSNTIPSSFEFVNYTFLINGCTRAFTHQLVRSRQNSYAQQTMRILDVEGFDYQTGPTVESNPAIKAVYDNSMHHINQDYERMIKMGAAIEDARGVLPTNICTNIVVQMNLRTAAELLMKRASPRTQGEYRDFIEQLRTLVLGVHPWAEMFLKNKKHEAAKKLDDLIAALYAQGDFSREEQMEYTKCVDKLRGV